jgi:phosphate transport system ATP-binding protein
MSIFPDSVPPIRGEARLRTERLRASIGGQTILRDVSLSFYERSVTTIIGPSGSGKTTLLRCLNRMHELAPEAKTSGAVYLEGKDIYGTNVDLSEVRRRVGILFDRPRPFATMTLAQDVLSGFRLNGMKPKNPEEVVEKALRKVSLWNSVKDRLFVQATALSRTEQQRLCLARCLALEPDVLLMDEPCAMMDPLATTEMEELIRELKETLTLVVATQSVQQAARVSDRTAFVFEGELVEFEEADVLFTRPSDPRTEDYITGRFG